DFTRNC
ncbi:M6 family metalloprotease domain protein, partial [Vibrio parahaemolyticus V-223/04]